MKMAAILLAALASRTLAAADPGERREALADFHVLDVGPDRDDFAFDLVSQRVRQFHVGHGQLVAAAKIEIAVVNVNVRMANAGIVHLEKDLGARGSGRRRLDHL